MHRNALIGICCLAFSVIANRLGEPQTYGSLPDSRNLPLLPKLRLTTSPMSSSMDVSSKSMDYIVENISNAKIHGVKRTKTASMRIPTWHGQLNVRGVPASSQSQVTIIGYTDLAGRMGMQASAMCANAGFRKGGRIKNTALSEW